MNGLFGTKHIILIAISLILVAVGYILSRKLRFDQMTRIMLFVGIISETVKIFYYIIRNEDTHGGVLPKTDLPFHLCSIQILFILALNFSKNEKLKSMLTSFMMPSCLIGGLAALLIATDSSRNGMWIITAQYFIYHAAIMIYALYLATDKEHKPTLDGYFSCLKMLLILMFFSIYINSILYDGISDINFMYVVGPPQKNLPFLNDDKGWLSYILRYASLVLVCVTLFYIKPIVLAIREKIQNRSSKNSAETASQKEEAIK
ncbi:MAG: hypothetical protein E7673_02685 [Ruminococcaceae bacterium]|nr:hypothetical protein [Oscillospiraceae bacterium]